jgi:hypothetical protein
MAGILDFEVRLWMLSQPAISQAGLMVCRAQHVSLRSGSTDVLQGTLSDGVALITLARWAPPSSPLGCKLACLGTHVKRPQTHLNEDSVACIHFLYAWR